MNSTSELRHSLLANLHNAVLTCEKCELCKTRNKAVPGEGPVNAAIMFVGEAPGHVNDMLGRPFVGHGGKIFDSILAQAGIARNQVFITNAVKCWPPDNRKPKLVELESCRNYLEQQIEIIKPCIIFALGATAFKLITGETCHLKSEHGKIINRGDLPVCALFHPNGIRYIKGGMQTIVDDIISALTKLNLLFLRHEPPTQGSLFTE